MNTVNNKTLDCHHWNILHGKSTCFTMNQTEQRNNGAANKARIKQNYGPGRQSRSPERTKSTDMVTQREQSNQTMSNIPRSEPKMVTLVRVSPRNASLSSRRGEPNSRAALQEKRSQYLEYASHVDARRRELLQGGHPKQSQDRQPRSRNYVRNNNVSPSRNGGRRNKTQSQPQLAHRQLSEMKQDRPSRQPPAKPQRHFSQSPPRPATRKSNKQPNGQVHCGTQILQNHQPTRNERQHSTTSQRMTDQQPKQREENSSSQLHVPLIHARTSSKSPKLNTSKSELVTQLKIKAVVHTSEPSSDVTSPRQSLPTHSLPEEESILSWIDKMKAQGKVSKSYPPPGRSQSAGPGPTRGSANKAKLQEDLNNFDKVSRVPRQRVTSPDSAYYETHSEVNLPSSKLPRERQSRLDEFSKANRIPKAESYASILQHQSAKTSSARMQSRIPKKKESVGNLRGEGLQKQSHQVDHFIPSNPEPPPRPRRSSRQRTPEAASNTKLQNPPSDREPRANYPQHISQKKGRNEPQAPPRIRKGSRNTQEEKRIKRTKETKLTSEERNRKPSLSTQTDSKHLEETSNSDGDKQIVQPASSNTSISPIHVIPHEKSLEDTPKRPKNMSSLNQELRRRLGEIMIEKKINGNGGKGGILIKDASQAGKENPLQENGQASPDEEPDVIDRMLSSTIEQDFKGELGRNLARRKTTLEKSLENEDSRVDISSEKKNLRGQDVPSRVKMIMVNGEVLGKSSDSGLGASYDSQTNPVNDVSVGKLEENPAGKLHETNGINKNGASDMSNKSNIDESITKETEFVVSEWNDEVVYVPQSMKKNTHTAKAETSSSSASPQPSSASPQPSSASPQPSSASPQPSSASPQPSSASPQPSSASPQPSSASPQPSSASPQPSSASPQPSSASPQPSSASPQPSLSDKTDEQPKRKVRLRRWSITTDGVHQRPVSYGGQDRPDSTKTSILSSMKVGISIPDLGSNDADNHLGETESSLNDSNGLLNVDDLEEEMESANTSSIHSTPRRSPSRKENKTPTPSSPHRLVVEDLEEAESHSSLTTNSVHSSPRRTTPPNERLLRSPDVHSTPPGLPIERSHQTARHALPIKVLPTSHSNLPPTFSEDHDMSAILPGRPITPQQSKSPSQLNQKSRYLKISGMQLLPQKLQPHSSKDKSKEISPTNQETVDQPDGHKNGHFKKSDHRGRERSKKDIAILLGPKFKKRSASADGFFKFDRDRSSSPLVSEY